MENNKVLSEIGADVIIHNFKIYNHNFSKLSSNIKIMSCVVGGLIGVMYVKFKEYDQGIKKLEEQAASATINIECDPELLAKSMKAVVNDES